MISNFYNIPIDNVKKFLPNFLDKEKYVLHYENLKLYLRLGLKLKNISCIRIQSTKMAKTICRINRRKKIIRKKCKLVVQINEQCCIW